MLAAMSAEHRAAIRGSTDSEHLFHLALSTYERAAGEQAPHDRTTPEAAPAGAGLSSLQLALRQVVVWCREIGQEPHLGLNVLLSDGVRMVGSRWQRSLHFLERAGPAACPVCGEAHAAGAPAGYRALLIASEPITREAWPEVPERSVFEITADMRLHALPLSAV
jgi:glutamine amidotransferase